MISTYCDTEEKKTVLRDNILKLKNLNVDVMVLSPLSLGNDIVEMCDFFYFTKENPILRWPERANSFWWKVNNSFGDEIVLHRDIDDYGWAALYQTKKLSQIALTYEYDIFYHMIYDVEINEFLTKDIENNIINKTYHRINPKNHNDKWEFTLHFIIFDKEKLNSFQNKIHKNIYLNLNGFAEEYLENIISNMDMLKSEFDVKDVIRYIDSDDDKVFDYSLTNEYKVFFSKKNNKLLLVMYGFNKKDDFLIKTNDNMYTVEELVPIELNNDIESLEIISNKTTYNYIDIIKKITRNVIEYNKKLKL